MRRAALAMFGRRAALRGAAALLASALLGTPLVHAQTQPANAIRIVVGYPAGQTIDTIARNYATALQRELGTPVYVDNRAGANGILGAQEVKRAPADGKTILFATSGQLTINPSLYKKLPYDTTKDFAPVSVLTRAPLLLVANPSFPPKSVPELIAYVKANPGKVDYGSGGQGITGHLGMEIFQSAAGIKMQHVPYKGSPAAITDVMAGTIPLMLEPLVSVMPHVKSGRLKALGVTGTTRNAQLPDVPTIAEQGLPGFEVVSWAGVVVPAGTPEPVVQNLAAAIKRASQSKEVVESMRQNGIESSVDGPAEFGAFLKAEIAKWGKAVAASGVQLDS